MSEFVHYNVDENVATIELYRPEKKNALTIDMWNTITEDVYSGSKEAQVVVLTGYGDIFCAGDDIETLQEIQSEGDVRRLTDAVLDCFAAIEEATVPVVGNPGGSAYGGGFELLLAADLTVVPEGATFALPEVQIGAYPFYGAKRLARMIGRQRAMLLALTGQEVSGKQAADWGLFASATPSEQANEVVDEIISDLKKGSPAALETTKSWLNAGLRFPGEDDGMRTGLGYLFAGPDAHEGASAFIEGRSPDFAE